MGKHFLPILKLRDILRRITKSVVYGLIRSHGQYHVGASPCQHRVQQRSCVNDFHVDLHSGVRSKAVVHHGFQNGALVPSGKHPHLDDFFLLVINVAHGIVVHYKGSHKRLNLMPELCKEIRPVLFRLRRGAAYHQIIHVQLGLAQVQGSSSQGGDVILKGSKFQGNLLRLFTEALQLLGNRLGRGNLVCLLSAVRHHVVHYLVQSLGLQLHCLYNFRIVPVNVVVSVLVGVGSRVYQHLSVYLVQPVGGILQLLQNGSHTSQSGLQPDGMCSRCQIKIIGSPLFVRQGQAIPVVAVVKGDFLHLGKRDFSVNINASAGNASSGIVLTSLYHNVVIAVLRNFKIPFYPLPRASPGLSAHIIENRGRYAVGLGSRGGSVVFCVKGGFGTQGGILALYHLYVIQSRLTGSGLRLLRRVLLVGIQILHGAYLQLFQNHGLVFGLQADFILTLFQIKQIGLRNIAHIVPEAGFLPVVNLYLGWADFVALVVCPGLAAVGPDSGKGNVPGVLKGNLTVYINRSLSSKQIHLCTLPAIGRVPVGIQIFRISASPFHALHSGGQVCTLVLVVKILHTAQRRKDGNQYHRRCSRCCHNYLFNRVFHTFLHKIQQ